jgi:hypothetical protein
MVDIRISVKLPDPSRFSSEKFIDAIERAQRDKTVPALTNMFKQTVEGWANKPDFRSEKIRTSSSIGVRVYAAGEHADQYALVVRGSPAHTIRPKNGGFLRFQPGYRAGTRPRMLNSRSLQRFGGYVQAEGVHHPGFEAREFDEVIGETHKPDFERDMQEAFAEAAK